MALNEAYGQTDVIHDPRWIMANYKGRKREDALRNLQIQNERTQQEREFGLRQAGLDASRSQAFDINESNRASREMMHNDNLSATTLAHESQQAGLKEAHDTQRAQQLQIMAADPNLGKPAQEAAKVELIKLMGLTIAPTATGAKGEYGPGGVSTGSALTPPTTSYNAPTDAFKVDQATGVGSGAASPEGFALYRDTHSTVNPLGQRVTTLPSGGTATADKPKRLATVNPPPNESMVAQPVGAYTPPTNAFTGGNSTTTKTETTPTTFANPQPNPTPAPGAPQPNFIGPLNLAAPATAPTPSNTPPAIPAINPQASNDRQDLLRDTENIFYGGGNAPAPTPTPTPQPQRVASAEPHPMTPQALAYLRLLGLA